MNKRTLLDNSSTGSSKPDVKDDPQTKPNLFQGRTDAEDNNVVFPDWDIVPPSQFINPRIKQR